MQGKFLIFEVTFFLCDAIYIGHTEQTFKKITDSNFLNFQLLLKNRQELDSFAAHYIQHSKYTAS